MISSVKIIRVKKKADTLKVRMDGTDYFLSQDAIRSANLYDRLLKERAKRADAV